MSNSDSVQSFIDKAAINKKITKWLPRLEDSSSGVREEAANILAKIAVSEPSLRDTLLPLLLKRCRQEDSWPVICNSILFNIAPIPKKSPEWIEPFISTYVELARMQDVFFGAYVVREHALGYIWELIKARKIKREHPRIKDILEIVSDGLSRTEDEPSGDERLYMMRIQDWHEDE